MVESSKLDIWLSEWVREREYVLSYGLPEQEDVEKALRWIRGPNSWFCHCFIEPRLLVPVPLWPPPVSAASGAGEVSHPMKRSEFSVQFLYLLLLLCSVNRIGELLHLLLVWFWLNFGDLIGRSVDRFGCLKYLHLGFLDHCLYSSSCKISKLGNSCALTFQSINSLFSFSCSSPIDQLVNSCFCSSADVVHIDLCSHYFFVFLISYMIVCAGGLTFVLPCDSPTFNLFDWALMIVISKIRGSEWFWHFSSLIWWEIDIVWHRSLNMLCGEYLINFLVAVL